MTLQSRSLGRDGAGAALDLLAEWTSATTAAGPLHPGDIGWHLRFDDAEIGDALRVWHDGDGGPVAITMQDGPVLRCALASGAYADPALAADLAAQWSGLLGDGDAWCDVPTGAAVSGALLGHGWQQDPDDAPWLHMVATDLPTAPVPGAGPVSASDVADRVAVQRAAFEGSTFTVERHRLMSGSAAGSLFTDVLARTPEGVPAAAATGWVAGPGRCGLLEPVGTHPDHRGHGYGTAAVRAACAELARRGASAVAVLTPSENAAAVALYRSAGFAVVGEQRSHYRPAG